MEIDQYGRAKFTSSEIFEALYNGTSIDGESLILDNKFEVDQFNQSVDINADPIKKASLLEDIDIPLEVFDKNLQKNWFIPEEYKKLDIKLWLIDQCKTEEEKNRVKEELDLFLQKGMYEVLLYLKYLVDTMRENNIVWGVGRGSSVASYCLYLIGIHKINSIRYELDIHEFLK